jgi:hypothetical protein
MKIAKLVTLFMISISWSLLAKERVAGTEVNIEAPEGFEKATQFPGYLMKATSSSIMVTAISGGPFTEITKGFNKEGLASKGMKLISKEDLKVGDAQAVLIHASQKAYGVDFLKWMLVFGDKSETVMVVASFPKEFEGKLSDILKKSVLSAERDDTVKLDFFEGVTFRVKESGAFKIANKLGNNLILTVDAVFPQKDKTAPLVIVGSSVSQDWKIPNAKLFCNKRLLQNEGMTNFKIIEEKGVKIDGLDGYLIYATASSADGVRYVEQCLVLRRWLLYFSRDG